MQPGDVQEERVRQQLAWASFMQRDIALDSSYSVDVVDAVYPARVINASCDPTYDGAPVTIERMGPHPQTQVVKQRVVLVLGCNSTQRCFIKKHGLGITYSQFWRHLEQYGMESQLRYMDPILRKNLANARWWQWWQNNVVNVFVLCCCNLG